MLESRSVPEQTMAKFHVEIGETFSFSKTVSESDIYLFAGITGDFAPNHVNEAYMKSSPLGGRIAHGALVIGYTSTIAAMATARSYSPDETPVSVGYDRIRFLAPVFIGDTLSSEYKIASVDVDKRRSLADIRVVNQKGKLVCVGTHIIQWVRAADMSKTR
jgi:3-hydroxybutyryl-CoA dehydratase